MLPLSKKLAEPALALERELRRRFNVFYDEAGNIGRRYRRQDEAGTPYCVTLDFEIGGDGKVTVRERDSMDAGADRDRRGVGAYVADRLEPPGATQRRARASRRPREPRARSVYFFGDGRADGTRRDAATCSAGRARTSPR